MRFVRSDFNSSLATYFFLPGSQAVGPRFPRRERQFVFCPHCRKTPFRRVCAAGTGAWPDTPGSSRARQAAPEMTTHWGSNVVGCCRGCEETYTTGAARHALRNCGWCPISALLDYFFDSLTASSSSSRNHCFSRATLISIFFQTETGSVIVV